MNAYNIHGQKSLYNKDGIAPQIVHKLNAMSVKMLISL